MKSIFKLLIVTVLVPVLVFSLAACGNNESHRELADQTVEGFMTAYTKMDVAAMKAYCVDGEAFEKSLGFSDFRDFVNDSLYGNMSEEEAAALKPMLDSVMGAYVDRILSSISYEIKNVKESNNEFEYDIVLKMLDTDDAGKAIENAMSEERMTSLGEEIALELVENGTITADSTEEEMTSAILEEGSRKIISSINEILDNTELSVEDDEIYVVQKDGKWLIDNTRDDLWD